MPSFCFVSRVQSSVEIRFVNVSSNANLKRKRIIAELLIFNCYKTMNAAYYKAPKPQFRARFQTKQIYTHN